MKSKTLLAACFTVIASLTFAVSAKSQILINGDFITNGATDQSGAAVLGTTGDIWNALNLGATGGGSAGTFSTITDNTGTTLSGVSLTYGGGAGFGGSFNNGGSAMDAGTTNLMQDYVFSHGGTITFSLAGLTNYVGDAFTLVVYSAGDTSGQGSTLTLTAGGSGGNTASSLATSAVDRKISNGIGDAYNTFTGTLTGSTLTVNAAALGGNYNAVNGFQLDVQSAQVPEPGTCGLIGLGLLTLLAYARFRRSNIAA